MKLGEVELCCKNCHPIFSVSIKEATERDGQIRCPCCGVTTTYWVRQTLKFAA
jgi:DNA-directed RNA polymerase subunit RPC12/RpoP